MPLANYANLDFGQVKSTLREYLKENSNFTDYDFEGSNLSIILDVLAYNTTSLHIMRTWSQMKCLLIVRH